MTNVQKKEHPKELIEFKGKKENVMELAVRKDDLVLVDQAAVIEFRKMRVRYETQIKDLVTQNQVRIAEEQERAGKKLDKVEEDLKQEIQYKEKVILQVRKEKVGFFMLSYRIKLLNISVSSPLEYKLL